jgi:hypothetical protein
LKPNQKLLWLNDQGEKLFTSIEIWPNFAGTGKAYLTGLAVTDEPASLGTQELYFSRRTNKATYYAASVELGRLGEAEPDGEGELGKLATMFARFIKRFAVDAQQAGGSSDSSETTNESKPPMDEATAKALQGLLEQGLVVFAGIQTIIDGAAEVAPVVDQTPVDDVQAAVDGIVTTAEEEKQLSRQNVGNKALLAGLQRIETMFSTALNTPNGRVVPRTTGTQNADKPRVL